MYTMTYIVVCTCFTVDLKINGNILFLTMLKIQAIQFNVTCRVGYQLNCLPFLQNKFNLGFATTQHGQLHCAFRFSVLT